MKRWIALLLTAATLLAALSGCTASTEVGTTEPATNANGVDPAVFDAATHDLALALACGMRTAEDPEVIHSPTVLWNVIGWYCAVQANNGGAEELTVEEVQALQYALRPEKPFTDIPDHFSESDAIYTEGWGEDVVYRFPDYVASYQTAFVDAYEIAVSDFSVDTVKVSLTDKADGTESLYLFSFQAKSSASSLFPFVLSSAVLPSSGVASDAALTYEKLVAANTVTGLLRKYSTIGVESTYADQSTEQKYIFSKNGVIAGTCKYTAADGGKTYSGNFGNYAFYEEDEHCKASVYLGDESSDYAFDYEIAGNFMPGTVYGLRETDDFYTFFIHPSFAEEGDAAYEEEATLPETTEAVTEAAEAEETTAEEAAAEDETAEPEETIAVNIEPGDLDFEAEDVYYVVEKDTLALRKAIWNLETEYEYQVELTYGCEPNEYQLTDRWEELREITFVFDRADKKGVVREEIYKFSVPGDMELVPFSFEELTLYNNPENTVEYEYPGNDEDYIVYVTNVMG